MSTGVTLTLNKTGATAYTVRDLSGATVTSGAVVGNAITLTPPGGGWTCGHYRVYLTGPNNDTSGAGRGEANFGTCYGSANFTIVRNTAGFPSNAATLATGGGEGQDMALHGVIGVNPQRLLIQDVANAADPTQPWLPYGNSGSRPGIDFTGDSLMAARFLAQNWNSYATPDSAKTYRLWCEFSNGSADSLTIPGSGGTYGVCYVKDPTVDGSKVFIDSHAGSSSGSRLRIYYPNSSTLVETYDNQATTAAMTAAVNSGSAYVKMFAGTVDAATATLATAIGNAHRTGVINTVQYLYGNGVHYYEGPSNEPSITFAEIAHQARLFADAVHTGNASAKAIGPCSVDISVAKWTIWLGLGGQAYLDEISTHLYNLQGDLNTNRGLYERWLDLLARNGYGSTPVFDTEGAQSSTGGGVYLPRRALGSVTGSMLKEQYGIKDAYWYDFSHGFWGYPAWMENGDGSLNAMGGMYRTKAEETYGMTFHHRMDFASVQGNQIFFGNVYRNATDGTQVAGFMAQSYLPAGSTITLQLTGTAPASVTVVDCFGNQSTVSVSSNRVTVPVTDTPTWVRIPSGNAVFVYSCLDWGTNPPAVISQYGRAHLSGNLTSSLVNLGSVPVTSAANPPDTADIKFNSSIAVDRVIAFGYPTGGGQNGLAQFTVDTSADGGSTWTTRVTVDETALMTMVDNVSGVEGIGSTLETFWPGRWIFNLPLGGTFTVNAIRLHVTQTSYGPYPTIEPVSDGITGGGIEQAITLSQLMVPAASAPTPYTTAYATLVASETGLLGYWRLNETSGTAAVSVTNAPTDNGTYTSPFAFIAGPTVGGGAVGFSGTPSAGNMTFPTSTNTGDTFSIEFWYANQDGYLGEGTTIFVSGTIAVDWQVGNYQLRHNSTIIATTGRNYQDTAFHHIVVTKSGSTTHIYVDGVDDTVAGTNATVFAGTSTSMITPRQFSELAWYSVALTSTQVLNHFAAAAIPSAAPATDGSWFAPAPVVTGTAAVGGQLQCSTGRWTSTPTSYQYQWQDSSDHSTWANISGATRSDYVVAGGEATKYIRCQVKATNIVGQSSAQNSNYVGAI